MEQEKYLRVRALAYAIYAMLCEETEQGIDTAIVLGRMIVELTKEEQR